jgi:hypothetical protein
VTSPLRLRTINFSFQLNTCGYSPYVTSSLTRGCICRLHLLLVLASTVILRSETHGTHDHILHGTHDHILLSQIQDSPNLGGGQVPVFISPRNRVARLYPQALGSHFVTSYDSQGYGRGIRPCLHTGKIDQNFNCLHLHSLGTDCIENTTSNSFSIFVWVFVSVVTSCLPSHCLATKVFSRSALLTFSLHVTTLYRQNMP